MSQRRIRILWLGMLKEIRLLAPSEGYKSSFFAGKSSWMLSTILSTSVPFP